jgi:hypothetical protein
VFFDSPSFFLFHLCLPRYLHLHPHFPPSLSTSCMPCVHLNLICFQGLFFYIADTYKLCILV